jgi:hypothetical protein
VVVKLHVAVSLASGVMGELGALSFHARSVLGEAAKNPEKGT